MSAREREEGGEREREREGEREREIVGEEEGTRPTGRRHTEVEALKGGEERWRVRRDAQRGEVVVVRESRAKAGERDGQGGGGRWNGAQRESRRGVVIVVVAVWKWWRWRCEYAAK